MAIRKFTLKTGYHHKGQRLDQVLADWLPEAISQPVSKAKVRKLIVAGAVYLNGKRVRIASKELLPNARIDCMVDLARLKSGGTAQDVAFNMTEQQVLFEDDFIMVVDKPAGLPTQPTLDDARDNLFAAVKRYLAQRSGNPGSYLGLHHRLDRDTSGVVLLTKDPKANAGVAEIFSGHLAQKVYHALTERVDDPATAAQEESQWSVKNYLGRISPKPGQGKKKTVYGSVRSGGDFAETDFRLLERFEHGLFVEARPKTGRTHQIRVHLSEMGLPILGDATYGHRSSVRLMLHAACLTFPHPIHKTEISVSSPHPEDFKQCLLSLRSGKDFAPAFTF